MQAIILLDPRIENHRCPQVGGAVRAIQGFVAAFLSSELRDLLEILSLHH